MWKTYRALAIAAACGMLLTAPSAFHSANAVELLAANTVTPTIPKDTKAKLDQIMRLTNMAFAKVKSNPEFMMAVKAKDSAKVKEFLVMNGAPGDGFREVKFDGPKGGAQGITIDWEIACCWFNYPVVRF